MNKFVKVFTFTLVTGFLCSCGDDNTGIPEWPWNDPVPEQPAEPSEPETPVEPEVNPNQALLDAGWTNVNTEFGTLPEYINIFKAPSTLEDVNAVAYIAVSEMNNGGKWEVLGDLEYCNDASVKNYGATSVNTPSEFYESCQAPVVINAGLFFYAAQSDGSSFYVSQNLVMRKGDLLAVNQNYWVEDWSTSPIVMWYPTIGVFYQNEDGTIGTTWTYTTSGGVTYSYPAPADNAIDKTPLDVPSSVFPEGAKEFKAYNAIGGAGVLIHEGEIVNTWKQECLNVSADSRQPRTAIGSTEDGRLMLFVCEGRNVTPDVPGFTTGEVAEILKSIGCVEALNLDGGGSSCMLVNGKETIQPSDGEQRSVLTGIRLF